jgi:hypothetical protein
MTSVEFPPATETRSGPVRHRPGAFPDQLTLTRARDDPNGGVRVP